MLNEVSQIVLKIDDLSRVRRSLIVGRKQDSMSRVRLLVNRGTQARLNESGSTDR